ncbi:MAG: DUF898 domain-containing protein [Bacteroidetes bacterium]|nr:MAG: DUF898 domain-containing protein [Bacteroidota bacterium]
MEEQGLNSDTSNLSPTGTEGAQVTQKPMFRPHHRITFHGSNMQYLGLALYNLLLTVLTLGLYYPWAKSAIRKFLWQETEIDGSRFDWHGTGKEMFRGFIKAYLFLGFFFLLINFGPMFLPPSSVIWVVLFSYLVILAFVPLAIHGAMRYRLSRTSFRGIHFGYRGNLKEFYGKVSLDFLFTILTLGIYGYWLQINARRYVMKHSRFGDVSAKFNATGGDFLGLTIIQGLLIAVTIYIYMPWALINFYKFYIENTGLEQNGKTYYLKSDARGGDFLWVLLKSAFITIISLGLASPIASLWIHKFYIESISLSGEFDFDAIQQTEKSYKDATGDDIADILDLDF